MEAFFKELKRHIRIYLLFIKNSVILEMEYRANFFIALSVETAYFAIKVLYIILVYQTGVRILGLPVDAIMLFIGTFTIMTGIYTTFFFFNFSKIQLLIRDGSMDMFITKPISLQFMATLRNVNFTAGFPHIVGGLVIVIIGWRKVSIPVSLITVSGYIGFMISGVVVAYSIMLLPQIFCFWTVQANSIREISDSLWEFNNMPMLIYDKWMRRVGTFIFPIFVISNFAALFIVGKLSYLYIFWGIVSPVLFFMISRALWNFSVKNYSSASS